MDLEPTFIFLAKVAGAIGSIALLFKYLKSLFKKIKDFSQMPETIKRIESETRTNGGSSLRDAINRIEKRQLIQEQRTVYLLELSGEIAIFEADPHGNVIRANSYFASLVNKSHDELHGNSWVNNILNEDRDRVFKEFSLAINQKRNFASSFKIKKHDEIHEVECKINPVLSKDNEIVIWTAMIRKSTQF